MADNLTTQSGTPATVPSASVIATDDVTGVHFQKVKLDVGGDGVSVPASGDATYGLDVDVTRVTGNVAVTGTFYQATQPVSGTVAVTGAYQATQPVSLATAPTTPVTGTFWQATQPVSGTVGVTGVAIAANQLPDGHNVVVTSAPTTAVTGAFYQATQPVSMVVGPASNGVLTRGTLTAALTAAGGNGTIILAPPSGQFNYITGISIVNAGTVSTSVSLYSGPSATGLLIYRTMAPALGGSNITFPTPLKCRVDEVLAVLIDTTPSGNVWASAVGYTGA